MSDTQLWPEVDDLAHNAQHTQPAVLQAHATFAHSLDAAHTATIALAEDDARLRAQETAALLPAQAAEVGEVVPIYFVWTETISEEQSLEAIMDDFSLPRSLIEELNPDVSIDTLGVGDSLVVARFDPEDPARSHGRPNRGRLINGVPMPDGPHWRVRHRNEAYGTWYTIGHLVRGFTHVGETLPGGEPILIGDISNRRGRRMRPHRSHQSGRDVDATYYLTEDAVIENPDRFTRASRDTMNYARQWALFSYWIDRDLVTYIFMDRRLQRGLYRWAVENGVDEAYLAHAIEASPNADHPIIRHARGHSDHFHVRFRCNEVTDVRCSE